MAGTSPKVLASKGYEVRGEAAVRYGRTYSIRSLVCRKNRKCIKEASIPTVTANSALYYDRFKQYLALQILQVDCDLRKISHRKLNVFQHLEIEGIVCIKT